MTPNLIALALLVALAGCSAVGPDYKHAPNAPNAPAFKELKGWKEAQPADGVIKGKWWEVYQDPTLNQLMGKVDVNNQNLRIAEAQYQQALALVQTARAGQAPTVGATGSETLSGHGTTTTRAVGIGMNASWEPDLWGSIRRTVESNTASAQASAAELEAAKLSARSTLATTYFQLRVADIQKQLYNDTLNADRKALDITQNQYAAGIAKPSDVALAKSQLDGTLAQATDIDATRAPLEHAIAVLVGEPPENFTLPMRAEDTTNIPKLAAHLPPVPVGVPSQLLERRPDIAAAERRVAAANAKIGVAQAAYYPTLTLGGSGGYQGSGWQNLLDLPNRVWSLGPNIALSVFDNGAHASAVKQAQAVYDQDVATYRQTVLSAFQSVEDNLSTLRVLETETAQQEQAVADAQRVLDITLNQYKAGIVSYLNVTSAQATLLGSQRSLLGLLSRRLVAHVGLMTALGGGVRGE